MDFLDPKKKRKSGIQLIIGYFLVAIAIGLATLILIFLAYGYTLDRKTGTVIQNGIVYVSSKPSDAEIYLNGNKYEQNTDSRIILPSAEYTLEIRKEGYRSWQQQFFLSGGKIVRLVYPFLFPNELKNTDVETFATAPTLTTQSPDRRWLLLQTQATQTSFQVYDLNESAPLPRTITIPATVLSPGTSSFELVEWSNDNRHVLLRHRFGKSFEYIVVDREQPAESLNVTSLTKGTFTEMTLRDKKFDQWILHDVPSQQLFGASKNSLTPRLLLQDVVNYKTHGTNIIMYATEKGAAADKARIIIWDNGRSDELRTVSRSKQYLLDVARFDNRWYFVAAATSDGRIYVYEDPFNAIRSVPQLSLVPATIMRLPNPTSVSFSQNTRFVSVQSGSEFAIYDAETERSYRYDTKLAFAPGQKATWMDGHRLTAVVNKEIVVFDFDGKNKQSLGNTAVPASLPYFSANYERLYRLLEKPNSKEANLTVSPLIVQ